MFKVSTKYCRSMLTSTAVEQSIVKISPRFNKGLQQISIATISSISDRFLINYLNGYSNFRNGNIDKQYIFSENCIRRFATSKKGKGKKGSKTVKLGDFEGIDFDDEEGVVSIPDSDDIARTMDKSIKWLEKEFRKMSVGQVNANMFDDVQVERYGPISAAGQVSVRSPTKVSIKVYDPAMAKIVAEAIKDHSSFRLNPSTDGAEITINIPKPSKESRDETVKAAKRLAEKVKVDLRHIRQKAMDKIKKCKSNGQLSQDEATQLSKSIDQAMDRNNNIILTFLKEKEKEIVNS